jgi:hypothetical protein
MVPQSVPEMSTLANDKVEVLRNVRAGFVAGYDALRDVCGVVDVDGWDAERLAEALFPDDDEEGAPDDEAVLNEVVLVPGMKTHTGELPRKERLPKRVLKRILKRRRGGAGGEEGGGGRWRGRGKAKEEEVELSAIEKLLPATRKGKFRHLAKDLRAVIK